MVQEIKKSVILLTIAITLLSGCAGMGTETGNPFSPTDTGNPNANPCPAYKVNTPLQADTLNDGDEVIETEFDTVLEYLCLRIFICNPEIHTLDCIDALNGSDGDTLLAEFGLSEDLWTVAKLQAALAGGNLQSDATALAECEDDILAIACEDVMPNVAVDDFVDVENIIPASCEDVFDDSLDPNADGSFDPCS